VIKQTNKIEEVSIVARRGLLNAAFTLKELRELTKIPSATCHIDLAQFREIGIESLFEKLSRPRRRLTEYMYSIAKNTASAAGGKKVIKIEFLKTPRQIILDRDEHVRGVKFECNSYDLKQWCEPGRKFDSEEALNSLKVLQNGNSEISDADLIVRSIGYKNVSIDEESVPFDKKQGVVPNERGRVTGREGLYCTGWIKRGPRGVIVDTTSDAHKTANQLCADIAASHKQATSRPGSEEIIRLLKERHVQFVDKSGWARIDAEEVRRGALAGKPREKINNIAEMLQVALK
jgi:adrenodoxin-NADP+ reductase